MCIPFPRLWRRRLVLRLHALPHVKAAMAGILAMLALLFFDAWRDISSHEWRLKELTMPEESMHNYLLMQIFRAQRNCYITGFSMVALIVIDRLASLLGELASRDDLLERVQADLAVAKLTPQKKTSKEQRIINYNTARIIAKTCTHFEAHRR
eukprot:Opistho-2@67735